MSYEIKNEISSCHVSMDFLKDIEQYLREQADNLSVEEKKYVENSISNKQKRIIELNNTIKEYEAKENKSEYTPYITEYLSNIKEYERDIEKLKQAKPYFFEIVIKDKQGKEVIDSFYKMSRSTFENEVNSIEIEASSKYNNSSFRIGIEFSEKKDESFANIKITGDSAKETARGIMHELRKRTLEYNNYNGLYYGWHNYVLYILALIGPNGHVVLDEKYIRPYNYIYVAFLGLMLTYVILRSISPYCTIPTIKNEKNNKFKKWLFGITISFLLSVGLFYFKSNVLEQKNVNKEIKDSNISTR